LFKDTCKRKVKAFNSSLKVGTRSQWADFQLLDDFGASSNTHAPHATTSTNVQWLLWHFDSLALHP
jgi:hypothetical protein